MTTRRSSLLPAAVLGLLAAPALADQVFFDDLIVQGSICAGLDCVNGESFGFDTIRMKENNLRIRAVDTSNSASFPSRDWQLTFNDSTNGGLNKFSIDDIDAGTSPFTIEGSAPNNALYVDDGGRVGVGTSQPAVELHIPDGDTPTLRLEQDGTSGFTPQIWDVAGNETNFFVRDVTNGSALPLRIRPGADQNALFIDADNDIGLGTASPDGDLHIVGSEQDASIVFESPNAASPADVRFNFSGPDNVMRIVWVGSGANKQFTLNQDGDLALNGSLSIGEGVGTNKAEIFVDSTDGDLKIRFADGFVATLAADS